jgi:GT2 family glycosyltransferase
VDLLVVPSVWIENAPFIIREAFAAGAPVVASDLGGMSEMVRDGENGRLFPAGDAAALAKIFKELADRPGDLARLRAGITPPMSIADDASYCRAHYVALAPAAPVRIERAAPAAAARLRVSAVVLNYRTADQTTLAVRSIQSSLAGADTIVVVDNGSADGSVERLRAGVPGVTLIEHARNLGFSAGCNAGIRHALADGADAVLLVNSDAVLAPGALGTMRDVLAADSSLGIVAPVLLSREEPDRMSSAGIVFSTRTGRMRHCGAGMPVSLLPAGAVRDVDAVSGCVMLIRREVFDAVGQFDDDYFFSFEDIDLCLRARNAGFRTACVQEAVAYHEGGRSIGRRSARRVYFATRNHLKLSQRIGPVGATLARIPFVVGLNVAYVLVSREAPLVRGLFAVARGTWHHLAGRYGGD